MEKEAHISGITNICVALIPVIKGMMKGMHQENGDMGLRPPQMMIMDIIRKKGAVSMGELSNALSIAKANTTPLVREMIGKGLLQRKRSETDKRMILISMTPEGERLQKRLFVANMEYLRRVLENLEEVELARLEGAFSVILDVMDKREKDGSGE